MKKVITCLLFFGILSFGSLSAQTYFSKTIDFSSETETAYSITQLKNGELVILGAYFDHEIKEGYSLQSIFLMKLDEYGEQIWLQKYADSTAVLYPGHSALIETIDGGFGFGGGYSQIFPENLPPKYLIGKFDSLGNKEWFQTYGYEEYDTGLQAKQLPDGGFIMTGASTSFSETGEGLDSYDIYIVRTDKEGNLIWERHIENEGFGVS